MGLDFKFRNKGFQNYSYSELLQTKEWEKQRFHILNRDEFKCKICNKRATEPVKLNGKYFSLGELRLIHNNRKIAVIPEIFFASSPTVLHVHHKFYMLNKLPWEYEEDAYQTLCRDCHNNLHEEEEVIVFLNDNKIPLENLTECYRCHGAGYFDEYRHVESGICFRCGGTRYEEIANYIPQNI